MAFVRANGVVLHYDVRGADGRPPLVFCNSLGTDFRIWNGVAERLAGDYRIILSTTSAATAGLKRRPALTP